MRKYCSAADFSRAILIQHFFAVKTDCFEENGQVIPAKTLVLIDDDPIVAVYGTYLYFLVYQTYGFFPKIFCVGGKGPLSKYTNEKDESEGKKLARVCMGQGVRPVDIVILDKGTNSGLNLKDIVTKASENPERMIMCLTERLSSRIKLTMGVLEYQYPEIADKIFKVRSAGVFYYVPEQNVEEQLQKFNGKGFAKGLMWLAEIASLYDRYLKYTKDGKMLELEGGVPAEVIDAHYELASKYPLKNGVPGFTFFWQFVYCWFEIMRNKKAIAEDLERLMQFNREKLLREFDFLEGISYKEGGPVKEIFIKE